MGISLCTIRPFWLNHDSRGERALAVESLKEKHIKKERFIKKKMPEGRRRTSVQILQDSSRITRQIVD
jgi:hypothetical protein